MNRQANLRSARILEPQHAVVSREEWIAVRTRFLEREKELTRLRDRLSAERRELPWVKVEKNYVFDSPQGKVALGDLFDGRSQLVVYHFMLGPGWKEGCVGCSFLADHIGGALSHLINHDVSLVVVSRAPQPEIETFKRRMGWTFPWVSSFHSEFNYDYHVSFTKDRISQGPTYYNFQFRESTAEGEASGVSVFYRNDRGAIYHTYSSYARGGDVLLGAYNYLDLTPKGRNETGPNYNLTDWVLHHDRYGAGGHVDAKGRCVARAERQS